MTSRRSSLALVGTVGVLLVVLAVRCRSAKPAEARADSVVTTVTFRGARFDVVELPLDRWTVRVGWTPGGTSLADVPGAVRTNAGIFEPGFVPTGLLVANGETLHALEARAGRGNFFMKPNGVFVVTDQGAAVLETSEYDAGGVREATQSGPLLVRRGVLHPQLNETSNIALLRSGVGVRDGRTVVLAISRDDVNLWTFAALFRDELKCPDALYLDGVISALWAEGAGRDADLEKGPFAGVLTAEPKRLSAP